MSPHDALKAEVDELHRRLNLERLANDVLRRSNHHLTEANVMMARQRKELCAELDELRRLVSPYALHRPGPAQNPLYTVGSLFPFSPAAPPPGPFQAYTSIDHVNVTKPVVVRDR